LREQVSKDRASGHTTAIAAADTHNLRFESVEIKAADLRRKLSDSPFA
jgi:hypothetical protein